MLVPEGVLDVAANQTGLAYPAVAEGKFTSFTTKEGLAHDTVNVILQDRAGALWIGTRGGGLNRLKDGRFSVFTTKDGLADDLVFALHEDQEGSLWIGTYGGGLSRMKDGRFTTINRKQGLSDEVIHRLVEDGQGFVWMSSNRGVFRVSKRQLDEVADGKRERLDSVVYGANDAMRSTECNGGASSGLRRRDGTIWFPTTRGVVAQRRVSLWACSCYSELLSSFSEGSAEWSPRTPGALNTRPSRTFGFMVKN